MSPSLDLRSKLPLGDSLAAALCLCSRLFRGTLVGLFSSASDAGHRHGG